MHTHSDGITNCYHHQKGFGICKTPHQIFFPRDQMVCEARDRVNRISAAHHTVCVCVCVCECMCVCVCGVCVCVCVCVGGVCVCVLISPLQILNRWFESEPVRAPRATDSA